MEKDILEIFKYRNRKSYCFLYLNCLFVLFWVMIIPVTTKAQQDAQMGQYMQNKMFINPAAAGSNGGNLTLFYRSQWLSLPGSPKTMGVMADMPLANTGVGIGLNFINTNQGALSYTRVLTNYSYKIKFADEENAVFLGLQAGAVQYSVDTKDLILHDEMRLDPTLNSSLLKKLVPDFGFGAMLKLHSFYLGIATPHIFQPKIKFINTVVDPTPAKSSFAKIFRHYYLTAGTDLPITEFLTVQPSVLVKYIANNRLSADFNLNFVLSDLYWGGVGYRAASPGAFVFMAGLKINTLKFGYAYEASKSPLSYYAGATHELFLNFQFLKAPEVKDGKKPYFIK